MPRSRPSAPWTRIGVMLALFFPLTPGVSLLAPKSGLLAQEPVSILERAAAQHEVLDSFCADFRQEIEVTLLRETMQSRGELCQARSDRFDMRWTHPPGDRIVADGMDLWVYYPSTDDGQAFRTRIAGAEGRFDLHHEFLSDPGERYAAELEGDDTVGGLEAWVLSLTPRVPSPYLHARVWIDKEQYLIRKLVIREESESIRTVELSGIRLNPVLSAERFQFVAPAGVQVITR